MDIHQFFDFLVFVLCGFISLLPYYLVISDRNS